MSQNHYGPSLHQLAHPHAQLTSTPTSHFSGAVVYALHSKGIRGYDGERIFRPSTSVLTANFHFLQ